MTETYLANARITATHLASACITALPASGSASVETQAFTAWFVIKYPDLITLPEDHEWAVAAKRLRAGPQLTKSEFFKIFGVAMGQARADDCQSTSSVAAIFMVVWITDYPDHQA